MVKSTSSCFKIITCGSDSVDKDDLEPIESKRSTDKRGWSFRKRSARHRVLSNTVIAESPSTGNRESPESTSINYHAQTTVPEKISVSHWTNEYPLSSVANSNAPDPLSCTKNVCKIDPLISTESAHKTDPIISTESAHKTDPLISKENVDKVDHNLEESSAIVIQTAVRGYLAQRTLLKLKNVIKLQAAVRGHLVRSQAVGTLRCVQAITKMQALVRARRARLSLQGLAIEEKLDGHERHSSVKPLGEENSRTKANRNYSSTEKLLSNAFARQLMQSTPKKKQIHIKCDPSRPDSAWKWLDRWMSVSSSDLVESNQPQFTPEHKEQEEAIEDTASELGTEISAEVSSASKDMKSTSMNAATSIDNEENLITYDADKFVFQACRPTSSSANDKQQPWLDNPVSSNAHDFSSTIDTNQSEMLSTAPSQTQPSISNKPVADSEQPKRSMKRVASEQPETENKKPVFGSRKATNPAFVAVQSKFEGLSSTATSRRSISSTSRDVGVESKLDSLYSQADSLTKTKDPSLTENSISHETRVQAGGSECGSLLSITSTLDSPDRSEVEDVDFKQEQEYVEKVTSELNFTTDNASSIGNLDVEPKADISASQLSSSSPTYFQPTRDEDVNRESVDLVLAIDPQKEDRQPERSASDVQTELDAVTDQQGYRSSPEGSPRSHVTVPESHGTPSSQVSVNAKRSKLDKSGATQSRKYHSAGKRSPSNQNHDSGARSSTEQLFKDSKNGKRRNSFGSSKSNHLDQEPRDSSSSSSLPSYMQATESARAKAHAHISPRSSPDVQDKDIYIKKRHSLPGTNGKQGSPRMQRSMSQAQQGAKGNGTQSPHA
ncbi:IQ motif [Macleaya cordata]|uniref:IQ motif n=1 Tax=Macleaya cordata TaxID=56857 RepID=A0A200QQ84_MACCD|nr:IQ motif [Macleaya cordata]